MLSRAVPLRVLYVDDDRVNSLLFVEICRLAGSIEVESAQCGADALELLDTWTPDLLVIDLHLPDTTGFELLPALRLRADAPTLPAILCTADETASVEQRAREVGFDACWTKPVELQTVIGAMSTRRRLAGTVP